MYDRVISRTEFLKSWPWLPEDFENTYGVAATEPNYVHTN